MIYDYMYEKDIIEITDRISKTKSYEIYTDTGAKKNESQMCSKPAQSKNRRNNMLLQANILSENLETLSEPVKQTATQAQADWLVHERSF